MCEDDKIICDSCQNYQVHPSGVLEVCQAQKQGSQVIAWLDDYYRDKKFCGDEKRCKGYRRIPTAYEKAMIDFHVKKKY